MEDHSTYMYMHVSYIENSFTGSLGLAKQGLADIQLRSSEHSMHHPKLQAMVSIVDNWKTRIRKNAREKVLTVKIFVCSIYNSSVYIYLSCI